MLVSRQGFTLIELLIVVVILGILASIAIPKFVNTKEKTYIAAMKADLRNLSTVEEAFFYDSTYYTDRDNLIAQNRYSESSGVTVNTPEATPGGWSAEAVHAQLPGRKCFLYSGNATPVGPSGTPEGRIVCT